MILTRIAHEDVPYSDNIFQSGFWAAFRSAGRTEARSFALDHQGGRAPLVVLLRTASSGERYAYVPRGPHAGLDECDAGPFLEELAEKLRAELPEKLACIRFDTEFPSPFTDSEYWAANGQWKGAPRTELRELRMNFGTRTRALRKAPVDHLCPDTVIVDLRGTEDMILSRMRQTTRNSVRRAYRSGIEYRRRSASWLGEWHRLYSDTARRKNFYFEELPYFQRLFALAANRGAACQCLFSIISAEKEGIPLAGIILGISGRRGYYLYAGSSTEHRECMPNYGLQWEAIRLLRDAHCVEYDLMGVPPNGDPNHSMYGLYTFKTGLGGRIVHYSGCWDYPLDADGYLRMTNAENMGNR